MTLAVGMAKIFAGVFGRGLMAYWYHFVIMFEALFILTLLETGTRVARFVFQEALAEFNPRYAIGKEPKWTVNVIMSVTVCFLWGYMLYTGNIASLWRMLGIANQLLATIALAVGTTYLLEHAAKKVYALCTALPLAFVVVTVFTAGVQSIGMWLDELWLPETTSATAFSLKLNCVLAGVMLVLSALIVLDAGRRWWVLLRAAPAWGRPRWPRKSRRDEARVIAGFCHRGCPLELEHVRCRVQSFVGGHPPAISSGGGAVAAWYSANAAFKSRHSRSNALTASSASRWSPGCNRNRSTLNAAARDGSAPMWVTVLLSRCPSRPTSTKSPSCSANADLGEDDVDILEEEHYHLLDKITVVEAALHRQL